MATVSGSQRIAMCLLSAAACWLARPAPAVAFPETDPMHPSVVPSPDELTSPDVQDLQHQSDLLTGLGTTGVGWTILPRLSLAESFTDNVLQAHSPRRWDLVTTVAPGIAVVGNTSRVQLRLNYEPALQLYARTGSQNALTHQLGATGLVTLVPDLLYVDVRGLAGVQSSTGGIGGLGTLGQTGIGPITTSGAGHITQLGLTKQNLVQSSSFAVSPYVLYHFSDIGVAKAGISLSETSLSSISGFTAAPWYSGPNSTRQSAIEETASFQTGNIFSRLRDRVLVDTEQAETVGIAAGRSERDIFDNQIDYVVTRAISVYGRFGYERIDYSGRNRLNITGPTWGFGAVLTPDPDTNVSFGYGRQYGATSFTFDGRYALTPRTVLTGSYGSGIGTQAGLLRSQLFGSSVNGNGTLVNSQTGGQQFISNNALGISAGIFRFKSLTLGATTLLDRDTITVTLGFSERTPVGSGPGSSGPSSDVRTASASWTHHVNELLLFTANLYYSTGTPLGGFGQNSVVASLSGQYTLTETVSTFARYAFLQRQASRGIPSMYQDLFIVGITKQF